MKKSFAEWDEETVDLALEEITVGLDREEHARLLAHIHAADLEHLERTAAAIHLAHLGRLERPPAALVQRLQSDALEHLALSRTKPAENAGSAAGLPARSSWLLISGWLAAAVLLALMSARMLDARPDPVSRRAELQASALDLVRAEWKASADPLASRISGDVIWSSARQEGYMRFDALAPNDSKRAQYQLWIFDPSRDEWEARPVDGGVFDVRAGGEVVIPIAAKLEVRQAALFAVTLEAPGGVVVSKRERLLATASP